MAAATAQGPDRRVQRAAPDRKRAPNGVWLGARGNTQAVQQARGLRDAQHDQPPEATPQGVIRRERLVKYKAIPSGRRPVAHLRTDSGILSATRGAVPIRSGSPHAPAPLASRDRRHAHRRGDASCTPSAGSSSPLRTSTARCCATWSTTSRSSSSRCCWSRCCSTASCSGATARPCSTKLNMIIGAFFSECGADVLGRIAKLDTDLDEVRGDLLRADGVEARGLRARQAGVPGAQAGHRAEHRRPRGPARAPRPGEDVPPQPARQPGADGARGVHRPPLGGDAPHRGAARARRLRPPAAIPTARTSSST